jgi:hypothetical protein
LHFGGGFLVAGRLLQDGASVAGGAAEGDSVVQHDVPEVQAVEVGKQLL